MRVAKVSGIVGTVAVAALLLSACNGGSGSKKTGTPAPSGAAASSSAGAAPSASASPTGPDGDKYLAGFLKPDDFAHGLYAVPGYPSWDNGDAGAVQLLAVMDCYTMENGGEDAGSTMQAYQVMTSAGPNQDFATQKAYTFNPGDGTKMLQYIQLRINTECKAFDHAPTDGTPKIHTTMSQHAVPGLGDEAVALTATDTPATGQAATLSALMVRYGDTVLYVSFSNADPNKVAAFDLTSKVKTIAQNLHLG